MSHVFALLQAVLALVIAPQVVDPAGLQSYVVDREASQLYVIVHRAGLFSFLGHEHAIVPREWAADLCLADALPEGAHAGLVLQTQSLVIDSNSARELAGLGGGPDEQARGEIQERMLDPDHLAAALHPEIRLDLFASAPAEGERVGVTGSVTLRGMTRGVTFPVTFQRIETGGLLLSGSLRLRQSDFGIEPESRVGLVKVSNDVDLHFRLTALPTNQACATPTR